MTTRSTHTRFLASVLIAVASVTTSGVMGNAVSSGADTPSLATQAVWVPTSKMNVARGGHTATLLPNGKVLVVGGWGNASTGLGRLDSAELYDPVTGNWSNTGHLSSPRVGHSATLLNNGRVLVAGGDTGVSPPDFALTSTVELYDPATGTWALTGSMTTTRSGHTATLLQDGRVLVAGGYNNNVVKTAELYDPPTGAWLPTGELNVARYGHTATRLVDGSVLIAKGSDDADLAFTLSSAELYDPSSGAWRLIDDPNRYSSVGHTATLLSDGKLLFTGGLGVKFGSDTTLALSELFDPASTGWTLTMPLEAARLSHTATLMQDGRVLLVGGTLEFDHYPNIKYVTLASVERFDPNTATWTVASSLNTVRAQHTATLLADGSVLVAGGWVSGPGYTGYTSTPLDSAELYTIQPGPTSSIGRAIEYYHAAFGDYFITAAPDEIAGVDTFLPRDWARTGKSFMVWSEASAGLSPVCRFFSGQTFAPKSTHFYTAFAEECVVLKAGSVWEFEGEVFELQLPQGAPGQRTCPFGTAPLYRLYNNGQGGVPNHRYTNDLSVVSEMLAQGWVLEGEGQTLLFACTPQSSEAS